VPTEAPTAAQVGAGQQVYSPLLLAGYDLFVLRFSNRFAWRCPWPRLLEAYDRHVGARHLDIGVGTGFFLDRCRWPVDQPEITLLDLNPSSLAAAARRIQRYVPRTVQASALEPLPLGEERFDSVGLNFLLHCLPGPVEQKTRAVVQGVKPHLAPGAVVFGSTILGRGVHHNAVGGALMRLYNRKGVFSNLDDDREGIERALSADLSTVEVEVIGTVALFSARAG
jgi:SAM-dependent methyltransferase